MDILYTCDDNYVWMMGVSMVSLFENNKNINEINVYLLGENISVENRNKLVLLAEQYDRNFILIDMPEIKIPEILLSQRWPKSAFSRLYAGYLLPKKLEKILYLDCDTIIIGKLSNLWNQHINDSIVVYGVKDCIGKQYMRNIGLIKDEPYINAGVLLFNLKVLRKLNMNDLIGGFLNKYSRIINYADQDILNGILKGKIGILTPEYNVMTLFCSFNYNEIMKIRKPHNFYKKEDINNAIENPIIIHYTTCLSIKRPWYKNSTHFFEDKFLFYKSKSPWKDNELLEIECNLKNKIKNSFLSIPNGILNPIIGFVHSSIYPKSKYYYSFIHKLIEK